MLKGLFILVDARDVEFLLDFLQFELFLVELLLLLLVLGDAERLLLIDPIVLIQSPRFFLHLPILQRFAFNLFDQLLHSEIVSFHVKNFNSVICELFLYYGKRWFFTQVVNWLRSFEVAV